MVALVALLVPLAGCDELPERVEDAAETPTLDTSGETTVADAELDTRAVDGDDASSDLVADANPCSCAADTIPVCDPANDVTYANPCLAQCHGVFDWSLGACGGDCVDFCTDQDKALTPHCGSDGVTYESYCSLLCDPAAAGCTETGTCPGLFVKAPCDDVCAVPDPTRVDVGQALPTFACADLNPNSPRHGEGLSDVVLREQVWIAYLGSCT